VCLKLILQYLLSCTQGVCADRASAIGTLTRTESPLTITQNSSCNTWSRLLWSSESVCCFHARYNVSNLRALLTVPGALHSHTYAAFSLVCKFPLASHSLIRMTLLCTESATSSCCCKAVQNTFRTLLLNEFSLKLQYSLLTACPQTAIAPVSCCYCAGSKQAAQCPPTSACQPELEAFLTQAKQQMPSLAGRLTAPQLQDFLCSMHGPHQSAMPSSSSSASSIQVGLCMRPLAA